MPGRVLSTDDAGIGITTSKGSQALHWHEIYVAQPVQFVAPYECRRICLRASYPMELNLTGYPRQQQQELIQLIASRARLQPHPSRIDLFADPDRPLPEVQALMDARNQDIRTLVMADQRREAVQLYRDRTGVSQKYALDTIDMLDLILAMSDPRAVLQARTPDPHFRGELLQLIHDGQTRTAISAYQKRNGVGASEASDTIRLLQKFPALPPGPGH